MGYISNIYKIDQIKNQYNGFPLISCVSLKITISIFHDYTVIPLGELLSSVLTKYQPDERLYLIESEIEKILSNLKTNKLLIKNIDILFNPDYRLDILRLFIKLSRNRSIVIQWPGELDINSLIYSKPEYRDYRKYDIKDYDVICLK
ncbi:BREX-3 system P-loop-containing protein BrxF [Proteiniborus sp.]|uniref:BREX-3 system P-loop-containing protein BrxF n=1 Tax=Proteiniborus sp. TaxID=2079015 RepID=UPI003329BA16